MKPLGPANVLVILAAACSRGGTGAEPVPASSTTPAASSPGDSQRIDASAARTHVVRPCRVMAMNGAPTIALDASAPAVLHPSDVAQGWMSLAGGDSVTITLPRTGRELAFVGPALVQPCVGTDEAWLARGTFQGSRGSGESPGAEEWVVTPFGVVRYGAAILEVAVDDSTLRASLKGGSATILVEGASAWELLKIGATRVVKGRMDTSSAAADADRCAKATASLKLLDDGLAAPGAPSNPGFGELAARANDAHVLARAACALSGLRAASR